MLVLGNKEVLANVECDEGDSSNAKARKGTLESVDSGERALVSPCLAERQS